MGGGYREISRTDRLVHTEKFDNAWYPGEAVITTILIEKAGTTTMTVTIRYESKKARDGVLESDMKSGVAASYDRLDDVLLSMR